MSNKKCLGVMITIAILCCGTWILAQSSKVSTTDHGAQPLEFSISKINNDAFLLDLHRGKTWILRNIDGGKPSWLPIPRIDSEVEAKQLWSKSTEYIQYPDRKGDHLTLDKLLKDQGFRSISLDRLRAGYLGIEARIEGKKVYLMLDTGAPVTHLDLERTKHLKLKWQSFEDGERKKPAAAGQRSFCEISKLEIGGLEVSRLVIGGHDESEMNKALKSYMDPLLDGELGSDVLLKLNAIIDYSTLKLYIRGKPGKECHSRRGRP